MTFAIVMNSAPRWQSTKEMASNIKESPSRLRKLAQLDL